MILKILKIFVLAHLKVWAWAKFRYKIISCFFFGLVFTSYAMPRKHLDV